MAVQARISSPRDRDGITELMHRAFGSDLTDIFIDPRLQQWKYWDVHPFAASGRSYVLDGKERIVGHACRWPMRLLTTEGAFDAFHLIDWAADSSHAGAGLQVLRDSCEHSAAMFSIGGSPTTRRVLPALGQNLRRRTNPKEAMSYQLGGTTYFLSRPLKVLAPALQEAPLGWRTPARIVKNAMYSVLPIPRLPAGYSFAPVSLTDITEELWPRPTVDMAVSARPVELFRHFANCPVLRKPMYFVVIRGASPIAYFFLVQVGEQVRLADYGPAGLDESAAHVLGTAAQLAARRNYQGVRRISTVTSERPVRAGLLQSGFLQSYTEEIRGLIADPALLPVKEYRLTYLDLDALYV